MCAGVCLGRSRGRVRADLFLEEDTEALEVLGGRLGAKQTSQTGASQQRAQLFSLSISSSRPWLLASADAAWTKSSGSQFSQTASAKF